LREDRLSSIASTDPNVRASAAKRLETEHPDEFTALSEALLHGPSARVRMNAAEQMGFGDPNQTLPVLEKALSDSDPDFSAYPHFALYWIIGFRGAEAILERPALMRWLERMRPFVKGDPPILPVRVCKRGLP
jgi:hypothetical protein